VRARQATGAERFLEVFVDTPLEVCEQRDPKGLYRKSRSGELREFTGVSSPFERPQSADLVIDTVSTSVAQAVVMILDRLVTLGLIASVPQPGDQTGGP
jgi:adenylylsulfate kinase-like enzyme